MQLSQGWQQRLLQAPRLAWAAIAEQASRPACRLCTPCAMLPGVQRPQYGNSGMHRTTTERREGAAGTAQAVSRSPRRCRTRAPAASPPPHNSSPAWPCPRRACASPAGRQAKGRPAAWGSAGKLHTRTTQQFHLPPCLPRTCAPPAVACPVLKSASQRCPAHLLVPRELLVLLQLLLLLPPLLPQQLGLLHSLAGVHSCEDTGP